MTTVALFLGAIALVYFAWCTLVRYIDGEVEFQLRHHLSDERRQQESVREIKDEMRRASQAMISAALEPQQTDSSTSTELDRRRR